MRVVIWCLLVGLVGCSVDDPSSLPRPVTPGDPNDGNPGGDGDDNDASPGLEAFARCFGESDCAPGLDCVDLGTSSHCLSPCTDACGAAERCVDGYCYRAAEAYAVCGALDACDDDALCLALAPVATPRCVPICAVGDLSGKRAVTSCPPLPADIDAAEPSCTPWVLSASSAWFCTAEVAVGERCDGAALRCSSTRPDTDEAAEPAEEGEPDPGSLACLPRGDASYCARVCETSGACSCPAADPRCEPPQDPGVSWACVSWPELADGLRACAPVEACTDDAACADNVGTALTRCGPSPYQGGPENICTAE